MVSCTKQAGEKEAKAKWPDRSETPKWCQMPLSHVDKTITSKKKAAVRAD